MGSTYLWPQLGPYVCTMGPEHVLFEHMDPEPYKPLSFRSLVGLGQQPAWSTEGTESMMNRKV